MTPLPASTADLTVLTPSSPSDNDNDDAFYRAIVNRCYNDKRPSPSSSPDVIFQAKSVQAVQTAVQYCSSQKLNVCVRSGGHNWEGSWLQGSGTALLDVGDLRQIEMDAAQRLVHAGPGATGTAVVQALAEHDLFFPCGHCDGVALGGFLLGGGYGIGFPKYGMASTWVSAVDVVLADGSLVTASSDSSDAKQRAILHLVRGAYTAFPGVITKYTLGPLLPTKPKGVMSGTLYYKLTDWPKAFALAKTIHKDRGTNAIEITGIMTYAPPEIQKECGESMVTMLALMMWGDTPQESLDLWQRYANQAEGLLVPPSSPIPIDADKVPAFFKDAYPDKLRYQTQVFMGNRAFETLEGTEEMKGLMQPLVDMWMSDKKPPAPSHTLLVCVHPNMQTDVHKGQELALGYTPDLGIQTYAMYTDAAQDEPIKEQLVQAHATFAQSDEFHTSLVEGETKRHGYDSGFATEEALRKTRECIELLDPNGVFAGCPK